MVVNPDAHKPAMPTAAFTIDKIILSEYNARSIRAPYLSASTFSDILFFSLFRRSSSSNLLFPSLFLPFPTAYPFFSSSHLSLAFFRSRSRFHCDAFERSFRAAGTPNLRFLTHTLRLSPFLCSPFGQHSRYIIPVRQIQ